MNGAAILTLALFGQANQLVDQAPPNYQTKLRTPGMTIQEQELAERKYRVMLRAQARSSGRRYRMQNRPNRYDYARQFAAFQSIVSGRYFGSRYSRAPSCNEHRRAYYAGF